LAHFIERISGVENPLRRIAQSVFVLGRGTQGGSFCCEGGGSHKTAQASGFDYPIGEQSG
jgi:hypothetical protein